MVATFDMQPWMDDTRNSAQKETPAWLTLAGVVLIFLTMAVGAKLAGPYINFPAAGDRTTVLVPPWDDTILPVDRAGMWCAKQGGIAKFRKIERSGGWRYDCVPVARPVPVGLTILNYAMTAIALAGALIVIANFLLAGKSRA